MKTYVIAIAVALVTSMSLAAADAPVTKQPNELESLVTNLGKEYKKVKLREVSPAGISIFHENGVAQIPFEDIPKELQEAFGGFDENAARKHREEGNIRLRTQELFMAREEALAKQNEQMKKRDAAIDTVKMPTRARIKQMNDGGALCEVSIKTLQKITRKVPRTLGGYDTIEEKKWIWSGFGGEWHFVAGLPSHLVDGDTWEGWTLVSGSHVYTNTLGARKTVRKLDIVTPPKK